MVWFLYLVSPQQDDLRHSGPPSGQSAGGGARSPDRKIPADLRADSLSTVPPTPSRTEDERNCSRSLAVFVFDLAGLSSFIKILAHAQSQGREWA
ncbi:hypothetical protein PoB_003762800 [Plakobranchus ocellatus]|uniref:Uncharacterized protein n=1 Tax=Plakobranchus ocellatus TaxID=259542 RepID=A0AAV4AUQ0_9GAST|nr:hypothetical protein PoB_003762800 [Plakobranchus ocellatus]